MISQKIWLYTYTTKLFVKFIKILSEKYELSPVVLL